MKSLRSALIVLCVLAIVVDAPAQVRKAGLNAAAFLKVGVGARNVGLGSASSPITEDVGQIFWNPEPGIALRTETMQGSFSYNKWIADLNHNAFGLSYKLGDVGTIVRVSISADAADHCVTLAGTSLRRDEAHLRDELAQLGDAITRAGEQR